MFSNFKCRFFSETKRGSCVIYIAGPFMDYDVKDIYECVIQKTGHSNFILCEMMVDDWDKLLTPWAVANCMKDRNFTGHARSILDEIEKKLLPYVRLHYPDSGEMYLAGYSLAGLFAMWALYETDVFDGAVSCSGSLWYPGWLEYMQQHNLHKDSKVYLSLGKKEEKTKHPVMKLVGTRTRQQYEAILQDARTKRVTLEWNEGGHFADTVERVGDGISWIAS